ncbi:MAG: hypothetical protein WDW38_004760 [Sanguina aurantia]
MSLIREALKGAQAEVAAAPGTWAKLRSIRNAFGHIAAELAGIATLAPYAARTSFLYHSLPDASRRGFPRVMQAPQTPATIVSTPPNSSSALGVMIQRNVSYGPLLRNRLDIYIPEGTGPAVASLTGLAEKQGSPAVLAQDASSGATGSSSSNARPVVFFVHGGVWASGEKWHYAPMAVRLAQEGCVVVVISYSMFPEVLCPAMVGEVSQALSWTLDNAAAYGGDPARIAALGHSAGSHLVAAALLQRARAHDGGPTHPPVSVLQPRAWAPSPHAARLAAAPASQPRLPSGPTRWTSTGIQQAHRQQLGSRVWGAAGVAGAPAPTLGRRTAAAAAAAGAESEDDWGHGDGAPSRTHRDALILSTQQQHAGNGGGPGYALPPDGRLPWVFIGMAGVYDISKHFEFERMRGVEGISMMKRAMGGFGGFDAMSPSVQLAQAWADSVRPLSLSLQGTAAAATSPSPAASPFRAAGSSPPRQRAHDGGDGGGAGSPQPAADHPRFFTSFPLLGDAIPARFTSSSPAQHPSAPPPTHTPAEASPATATAAPAGSHPAASTPSGPDSGPGSGDGTGGSGNPRQLQAPCTLQLWQAQRLCPVVLMSSSADHMVPWHESAEMMHHLSMCGVPARHLQYNHVRHSEYVLAWTLLKSPRQPRGLGDGSRSGGGQAAAGGGADGGEAMSPFAVDLLRLLFSEGGDHVQELECSRQRRPRRWLEAMGDETLFVCS